MAEAMKSSSGNARNMRLAKPGPWAECAMQITPRDCWAAADEIDRLRAALSSIARGEYHRGPPGTTAQTVARAALEGSK